jgi:hypothetical protein
MEYRDSTRPQQVCRGKRELQYRRIRKMLVILSGAKDPLLPLPSQKTTEDCHPERSEGPAFALAFAFALPKNNRRLSS